LDEGKEHELGAFHGFRHKGNLGTLVVTDPHHEGGKWPQTMVGRPGELADRLAIFAHGTPALLVTSFTASKALSRSIDATNAHDRTLAGDGSLNGGIFLAAIAVDKALKGSMAGERMNKGFGRQVRGRG
jgi:hypothetical protein